MSSIQLICMFYNCEQAIIPTLESWKSQVNFFYLFFAYPENKELDKTYELVKEWSLKNAKICNFKKIKFQGFSKSRNYCLKNSGPDNMYKWTIFIDDTYHYERLENQNLLEELETLNPKFNCIGIRITSEKGGNTYDSRRIIKTSSGLKYTGDIHENIHYDTEYIIKSCKIIDKFYQSHEDRSFERIPYDLNLLKDKTDHRSLYYIAIYNYVLYCKGKVTPFVVVQSLLERLKIKEDMEEIFNCLLYLAIIKYDLYLQVQAENPHYVNSNKNLREIVGIYLLAALSFEPRCGECYYHIYKITGIKHYINKAFQNKKLPENCRMPMDESIYTSLIPQEYEMSLKGLLINI